VAAELNYNIGNLSRILLHFTYNRLRREESCSTQNRD